MATKRALNKVASTEAGVVGTCRAPAKSVHRIIAVITARFDRLELRLKWPPTSKTSKRSKEDAHFKPCSSLQAKRGARASHSASYRPYTQPRKLARCLVVDPSQPDTISA